MISTYTSQNTSYPKDNLVSEYSKEFFSSSFEVQYTNNNQII